MSRGGTRQPQGGLALGFATANKSPRTQNKKQKKNLCLVKSRRKNYPKDSFAAGGRTLTSYQEKQSKNRKIKKKIDMILSTEVKYRTTDDLKI